MINILSPFFQTQVWNSDQRRIIEKENVPHRPHLQLVVSLEQHENPAALQVKHCLSPYSVLLVALTFASALQVFWITLCSAPMFKKHDRYKDLRNTRDYTITQT